MFNTTITKLSRGVVTIMPYDDEEQAIRLANATWSGLCSSVWTGDNEHGCRSPGSCVLA